MGSLRFVPKPGQERIAEIRALVRRLRDVALRSTAAWACWVEVTGDRFRVLIQDTDDTGRDFTSLAAPDPLVEDFDRFSRKPRAHVRWTHPLFGR
jgi:hypothetical protein